MRGRSKTAMESRTVHKGGSAEIVEKKSRFIGEVFPVEHEEEAMQLLEQVKKKYWDARHHCWAYVISGDRVQERLSDDGEPSGTAGKPILEVIRGQQVGNLLVVVTRYFGGTLLGTGGLVRAYTEAAKQTLAESVIITRITGYRLKIETDYTGLGKIQYLLAQRKIPIVQSEYTDQVTLSVLVSEEAENEIVQEITEATNGQADIKRAYACSFADVNGEMLEFPDE